jgi:phosphoribosylformylglycinamidine synthase PurS subunit
MGRQPGDLQSSFVSYSVCVNVMPKEGIADPQGQTIEHALPALGFEGVSRVRVGKRITLSVAATSPDHALSRAREMCERLLANTVIEAYEVVVSDGRVAEDVGS